MGQVRMATVEQGATIMKMRTPNLRIRAGEQTMARDGFHGAWTSS
jgi:hypothetical protein